ncbi:ATPase [Anoxybacter fermentans]|uniref:ATPase n=1 Tax=Anoxybacter fermentans TaxID=1323375 RepID=A0A3Q9HP77_9FIRM|nr:AAA family ATPase [Anoxybacter fermentans]AZR72557.1 ATPase [Anoxybacter fermentans]
MVKEIGIGLGLAVLIFLGIQGINIFPFLFFVGMSYILLNLMEARSGGMSDKFGNIKAKKSYTSIPKVTFNDIGGQETAKKELMEALDFIKDAEKIKRLGIRPLKGILLTGPPGTGKTLMAKAAANLTGSVFISASGSEFIEMYAGVGAKRVRQLFSRAREIARRTNVNNAIIFIDEIEVLGGKRGSHSGHMEYDQTLNQLLVEMDGLSIDDEVRILVIGATNRIDILDPAILRPGRFDRVVKVDLPDKEGRLHILKIHTANKPLADDVNLEQIARETFGFSGAHLESLTNEAAILAWRENQTRISQKHFLEAIDKVMMGEKLNRKPQKEELRRIAVHETGHALVSELVRPGSVSNITITSRGQALGYVRHNPQDDFYLYTQDYLEDQIAVCIAGAAAEELILGNRSTGAQNDFQKAADLAKKIIFSGMTSLGVVTEKDLPVNLKHEEMSRILKEQEERVKKYLIENKDIILTITEKLLKEESFTGDKLRKMLKEVA